MHVYARFHCICPCPVQVRDVWADTVLHVLVWFKTLPDKQWLWAHIWRALLCTWPVAPVALPARLGTCVFLQEQWFGTRNQLRSLQSKGKHTSYHILSKCLISSCSDSFNSIQGYPGLLTSADRKDYLTCGILRWTSGRFLSHDAMVATSIHLQCVSNRQIRQYNLCCHDLSMLIMIWFRKYIKIANAVNAHDLMIFDS